MSGVFLSYSRGDKALAEQVIRGLRPLGVDVWWDEDMPGVDWQEELARQIHLLAAVVVIWTPLSSSSKNVRDEARLGQHTDKLVNALSGVSEPPFPFDRTNGLPLDGWTGRAPHRGWTRLVQTIEDRLVAVGGARPGQLTVAQVERESAIRSRSEQIALAEEAFQAAKAGEEAAADAIAGARAGLDTAEDLLRLVVERRASGLVLRASQADVETAREGLAAATAQKAAAAAALATASRGLSRTRAELERLFDPAPLIIQLPASAAPSAEPPPKAGPTLDNETAFATAPESTPPAAVGPTGPPSNLRPTNGDPSQVAAAETPVKAPSESAQSWTPPTPRLAAKPIPIWAPIAGVAAVVVAGLGVLTLGQHKSAPDVRAGSPDAPQSAPAAIIAPTAAASPVASDPTAAIEQAIGGKWGGNGAVCGSNPFRIRIEGATLQEVLSGTPSTGSITGLAGDHGLRVRFPGDANPRGDQVYAIAGDALTLTISGDAMTYQRCKS